MPRCFRSWISPATGLIHGRGLRLVILLQVLVAVPVDARAAESAAIEQLHKAHAAFEQPAGEQAIAREALAGLVVQPVELLCVLRFSLERSTASGTLSCMRAASS